MHFEHLVLPPTTDKLLLLQCVLFITIALHVAYAGMCFAGLSVSVLFNAAACGRDRDLWLQRAQAAARLTVGGAPLIFALGILPLGVLVFTLAQMLPHVDTSPVPWLAYGSVGAIAAYALAYHYAFGCDLRDPQQRLTSLGVGLSAAGLAQLSYLFVIGSLALLYNPEQWGYIEDIYDVAFSWNVIVRFVMFLHVGLIAAGLRLVFAARPDGADKSEDFFVWIRRLGAGMGVAGIFVFPALEIWHLATIENVAKSYWFYNLPLVFFGFLFLGGTLLWRVLVDEQAQGAKRWCVGLLSVALLLWGWQDHVARANALQEEWALMTATADASRVELEDKLYSHGPVGGAEGGADLLAQGEEVYNRVCHACHRFDTRVVGPPMLDVLPKYQGDVEKLVDFINNPTKVNPDYPQMPKPPINAAERRAVATFELHKLEELAGSQGAAETAAGASEAASPKAEAEAEPTATEDQPATANEPTQDVSPPSAEPEASTTPQKESVDGH